ncbi:MAG: arsenate reductase family protein [Candidatus Acidiferrales bacterium]
MKQGQNPMIPAKTKRGNRRKAQFLEKPNCSTCRKARAFMEKRGFDLQLRDLGKTRMNADELDALIGTKDHREFLNTRNELYRRKNMKRNPPSREEAIRLMVQEPNLIRRPVILCGGRIVLGFDEEKINSLLAAQGRRTRDREEKEWT